jgi:short-subunit dehydrogenase
MRLLNGRTAIVTGASRGIGLAIAQNLSAKKMNLVLSARSKSTLEGAIGLFPKGTRLIVVPGDLHDLHSLENIISETIKEFGAVDVLVNNAGVEMFQPFDKIEPTEIESTITLNLIRPMQLARIVIPIMLRQGFGHIINIASLSAKAGQPCGEVYVASKAGLVAFTESLRAEYRGTGLSASVICPGFVETEMFMRLLADSGLRPPLLLGASTPDAVAQAVSRALEDDIAELIVNPFPVRPLTTVAEISPRLAELVQKQLGLFKWFKKVGENRQKQPTQM